MHSTTRKQCRISASQSLYLAPAAGSAAEHTPCAQPLQQLWQARIVLLLRLLLPLQVSVGEDARRQCRILASQRPTCSASSEHCSKAWQIPASQDRAAAEPAAIVAGERGQGVCAGSAPSQPARGLHAAAAAVLEAGHADRGAAQASTRDAAAIPTLVPRPALVVSS